MAKVREIKRHITSVNKIKQITKAMYAISMTRAFKSKQQLMQARAYSDAQVDLLRGTIGDIPEDHSMVKGSDEGSFVFVLNSDRGLCGRFKGDLNRRAEQELRDTPGAKLIIGGDKANMHFRSRSYPIHNKYINVYDKPKFEHARMIGDELLALYEETNQPIKIVYMEYITDFRQVVKTQTLLPLTLPESDEGEAASAASDTDSETLYEPSKESVFEAIVPLYVKGQLYRMILESKTSEHAIRRQSMRNATDNAEELVSNLSLEYNKARQQEITSQLLDIMGGAEALRNT
jgi:F-type H+-transporting ATPase subunit gamma